MKLNQYLNELLGVQDARKLKRELVSGKTVIVTGSGAASGKTTLVNVLNKCGYRAVEGFDTYEVCLDKPLNDMIPNMAEHIIKNQTGGKKDE
jgi:predicted ATPase